MTRHLLIVAAFFVAVPFAAAQDGPQNTASQAQLRVIVVDQTGAGIPSATVRVVPGGGAPVQQAADDRGVAALPPFAPGMVQLHVESEGFAPYDGTATLRRGANNQTVTLNIAGLEEAVVVKDTANDDRSGNALTTTLTADDIAGLSDDPDELAEQLDQMTGGAGATFIVDGFRGGRLPAKADILQIRFRMNSFSADNHDAGRVTVEIVTRPGLTAWSGNANMGFRGDALNSRNAFASAETPEQFRRFTGGVRGPLVRNRTSLRINVDGNRSFDTSTIFFAQQPNLFQTDLVRRPVEQTNVTVGLDHGINKNQTLKLEYRRSSGENRNLGVGDFNLAERAYTRTRDEDQFRASLQSIIGKSSLNAFRVQLYHTGISSQSLSTEPAVIVIDAFSSGGAGVANTTNNRTVQISDDLDFTVFKKHAMRAGFLLEGGNYQQLDARNGNGTFTFGSLESFPGHPTTYTQRNGQVQTSFGQYQLGVYWQDDVRVNRNLSLSLGIRQEIQTHLKDPLNVMPRVGFTWNPFGWKTALRGGYGIFHDFFGSDLYDQTVRVNGVSQGDLLILNPGYPDPFSGTSSTVLDGGRVQADPDMVMPYVHQASIGAERALSPALTVQASYAWQRGYDQLRSRNLNAPNEVGVRPEPTLGNITQIESTGRSALDRLTLGFNYRIAPRRIFMGANYTLANARNDGDNPLSLPANSLNPDLEWGPAAQDIRHHFNTLVNFPLPLAIRANINANISSGAPYTITTGRDDNHDGVTNDRPAGAERNGARGSGRVELNLRLTRGFGFGGTRGSGPTNQAGRGAPPAGGQVAVQGPPPGGGGPGGGPGEGGAFIGGPQGAVGQRFTVEFYAQASNLLNHTNFQNFSGNMLSPFFGNPTSAGQARRVEIGTQFRF